MLKNRVIASQCSNCRLLVESLEKTSIMLCEGVIFRARKYAQVNFFNNEAFKVISISEAFDFEVLALFVHLLASLLKYFSKD